MTFVPTCIGWHGCLRQQSYLKVGGHGHDDPWHSTTAIFLCVCRLVVLWPPKVLLCPDLCGLTVSLTSSLHQLKGIHVLQGKVEKRHLLQIGRERETTEQSRRGRGRERGREGVRRERREVDSYMIKQAVLPGPIREG